MGYQHPQNTLKAIALTMPAARALEMTVEFVLGEGKDTATVGCLEDHFRDRPSMKEARIPFVALRSAVK